MKNYRVFDHTADIGCEIYGSSRKELLANAVMAMFDILIDQPSEHRENSEATEAAKWQERIVTISGSDWEDLLINFLRESLYLFNGAGWIIRHCEIAEHNSKTFLLQ